MSERKVLNKYYPPDFDPTKIPKLKLPKNRTFCIRLMAPFNMRCNTCGEYIYKGKKFNSRKETVENENYLGLHIFRFYIKCPRCIAEIVFKTDPVNTDYVLEAGATRNFEALRTAERIALKEQQEKEDEEANNPMKLLENRTKASQNEMEMLETLEDLKELKQRHGNVNTDHLLEDRKLYEDQLKILMDEEDEKEINAIFHKKIKRLPSPEHNEQGEESSFFKIPKVTKKIFEKPTDMIINKSETNIAKKSYFSSSMANNLSSLVRPKPKPDAAKK